MRLSFSTSLSMKWLPLPNKQSTAKNFNTHTEAETEISRFGFIFFLVCILILRCGFGTGSLFRYLRIHVPFFNICGALQALPAHLSAQRKKIKIVIQIFSDLCYYIGGEFAMCGRQQCALPRINGIMHQKIHNTEEIMHLTI